MSHRFLVRRRDAPTNAQTIFESNVTACLIDSPAADANRSIRDAMAELHAGCGGWNELIDGMFDEIDQLRQQLAQKSQELAFRQNRLAEREQEIDRQREESNRILRS